MTFEQRFQNWIRWCREFSGEPAEKCGSLEGGYRSPQIWDIVEPNMSVLRPVIKWDAERVNRAFSYLADSDRRTIKFMYFRPHWRRSWVAQKLNCRADMLSLRLSECKTRLSSMLDSVDGIEYRSRHTGNSQMPSLEASAP